MSPFKNKTFCHKTERAPLNFNFFLFLVMQVALSLITETSTGSVSPPCHRSVGTFCVFFYMYIAGQLKLSQRWCWAVARVVAVVANSAWGSFVSVGCRRVGRRVRRSPPRRPGAAHKKAGGTSYEPPLHSQHKGSTYLYLLFNYPVKTYLRETNQMWLGRARLAIIRPSLLTATLRRRDVAGRSRSIPWTLKP